jgi:hypothetical protein
MKITNIKKKVYQYKGVQKVKIEFDVIYEHPRDAYESKRLQEILQDHDWLLKHYVGWRNWDEYYTIDLFKDSLHNLGKGVYNGHFVSSKKHGARALLAADMLDKLYLNEPRDKSYDNHMKRFTLSRKPYKTKTPGLMYELVHEYPHSNAMGMDSEVYERKMFRVIYKRQQEAEKKNKDYVWNYIRKYIEYWWR